jgi:hypothetical protein
MKFLKIFFTSVFCFVWSVPTFSASIQEEICNNKAELCKIACEAKRQNNLEQVEIADGKMSAKNSASLTKCLSILTKKN